MSSERHDADKLNKRTFGNKAKDTSPKREVPKHEPYVRERKKWESEDDE